MIRNIFCDSNVRPAGLDADGAWRFFREEWQNLRALERAFFTTLPDASVQWAEILVFVISRPMLVMVFMADGSFDVAFQRNHHGTSDADSGRRPSYHGN